MSNQSELFSSVRTKKISELIAQQIRTAILDGDLAFGKKLPPERELEQQFEASRHAVREALKILENSGLIEIKRGSGNFVSGQNSTPVKESFSNLLRMQNITLNHLIAARLMIEPGVAMMACENATEEDLKALEKNIFEASQKVEQALSARAENIEFHTILAEATHNPAIVLTLDTLYFLEKEMLLEATPSSPRSSVPSRHSLKYHRKILKALREKKPQKAYDITFKHILVVLGAVKSLEGSKTTNKRNTRC